MLLNSPTTMQTTLLCRAKLLFSLVCFRWSPGMNWSTGRVLPMLTSHRLSWPCANPFSRQRPCLTYNQYWANHSSKDNKVNLFSRIVSTQVASDQKYVKTVFRRYPKEFLRLTIFEWTLSWKVSNFKPSKCWLRSLNVKEFVQLLLDQCIQIMWRSVRIQSELRNLKRIKSDQITRYDLNFQLDFSFPLHSWHQEGYLYF